MDFVMESIQQLSGQQAELKTLKDRLNGKIDVILAAATQLSAGGQITVLQNAIGELVIVPSYTYAASLLLAAQAESLPDSCAKIYIYQCKLFFSNAAAARKDLLMAHKEVFVIAQKLLHLSYRAAQPRMVSRILLQATLLLAPDPSVLTPIHSLFLQSCISGQMYTLATSFLLANDVLEIDPKETSLTSQDFLEYFYYAGLCFIGVKDYPLALDHFLQAITLPAQVLSAIVVACIKASRLVSLISTGTTFEVPKYASHIVIRFAKQDMNVYDNIARSFLSNNIAMLTECISLGTDVLTWDHNLGLAKQVITSLKFHNIKKLTSTYITLSLEDIMASVGLKDVKETEQFLLKMVASKDIKASINHKTNIVRFNYYDSGQNQSSGGEKIKENEEALLGLEQQIRQTIEVSEKLREMQQKIITSEEYLSRSTKAFSSVGIIGKGGFSQTDTLSWADNDSHRDLLGFPTV